MNGIQFITDDKGRKTAMVIDLKKHAALAEDFWDVLISKSRMKEKDIPIDEVIKNRARMKRQSKPRA